MDSIGDRPTGQNNRGVPVGRRGTPSLHAILDVDAAIAANWDTADLAKAFLDGGVQLIQLRGKFLPSASLLTLCDWLVAAAEPYGSSVIVNDRVDLARMSGATGVHVGQEDLAPRAARRLLGADAAIGYSTHTTAQIQAAAGEPVTYIAIGPVFGTTTKATGYEPVGVGRISEAVRLSRGVPVVGIGGITLDTAPAIIEAGASSVAVIADLLSTNDPQRRVRAFLDALA